MSTSYPETSQSGQVITEGPESPYQDSGIPTSGNLPDDPGTVAYTVKVQTRPYRFETDGWDYTKSQTSITVNRGRYNTTV